MAKNPAPGGPGIEPRWTGGAKDAVGTAYSVSSRLWYTLANGVNTEIYYPTIDTPQVRDMQYMISDGETFFHDERRNTISTIEVIDPDALASRSPTRIPTAATHREADHRRSAPELPADSYQVHRGAGVARTPASVRHLRPASATSAAGTTTAKWFKSRGGVS